MCAAGLILRLDSSAQTAPATTGSDSNSSEARLHSYMEQAAEAMHKGDLVVAADALQHALALNPQSLAALNNLGIVLARQGKPQEAIPLYQRALKVRPGDSATERNLAVAYFKAHEFHSAWNLLRPLAEAYPADFQILDLAGLSLFALDRYPEAARYLERANQADPSDLETLDVLGKAYLRMKDYHALPSVFERIMKIAPNSAAAHVMMGTAYDDQSDRADAIKEYQAAEAADPNFIGVHSGLGYLYWREGKPDLAEKEMREELHHFPADPVAHCILGQILYNNAQMEDARSHFQLAVEENPHYGEALIGLGKTEIALNQPAGAIEPLRQAIRVDPDNAQAHFVLGTALRRSGHAAEGIREQRLSLEIQNKKNSGAASSEH